MSSSHQGRCVCVCGGVCSLACAGVCVCMCGCVVDWPFLALTLTPPPGVNVALSEPQKRPAFEEAGLQGTPPGLRCLETGRAPVGRLSHLGALRRQSMFQQKATRGLGSCQRQGAEWGPEGKALLQLLQGWFLISGILLSLPSLK